MAIKWLDGNRIQVDPPKRPKKITGTRFAAVLGLSPWATPFEAWCAICRVWEKPFEDTIYTRAGKIIEPKQAEYMRQKYFWRRLITPQEVFGPEPLKTTYGDFFRKESKVFGGMWDFLFVDKDFKCEDVLEMKSTKRAEDWEKDIPEYYALQGALYAYLKGVDPVHMVASFLDESDYADPSKYVCTDKNTIEVQFNVSERYPEFEDRYIGYAEDWWEKHVLTGISPPYDERADADILKALRTNSITPDTSVDALLVEAGKLKAELDAHAAKVERLETRYKLVTAAIKEIALKSFRDGDKQVELAGPDYTWVCQRKVTTSVDKKALAEDGLLDKYTTQSVSYTLTPKAGV